MTIPELHESIGLHASRRLPSRRVFRIDLDIIIAQIASPSHSFSRSCPDTNTNQNGSAFGTLLLEHKRGQTLSMSTDQESTSKYRDASDGLKSTGVPAFSSGISPSVISSSSTEKGTPAYPAAAAILPQLGSCPKIAALVNMELAMDLATVDASSAVLAPETATSIRQVAPSPSHATDFARAYHMSPRYPSLSLSETRKPAREHSMLLEVSVLLRWMDLKF